MADDHGSGSGQTSALAPNSQSAVVNFIRRRPIGAFMVWFFTVGWLLSFAPMIADALFGVEMPHQPFIVAATLIGMFLPSVVITSVVDGPQGLRQFWRRLLKLGVPARWYVFALLVLPVPAVILSRVLFGPPDAGADLLSAVLYGFVGQGVLVFVSNNLWEEGAVMGFLQIRLQDRHGPMRAAILAAIFFTFQHLALFTQFGSAAVLVLPLFFPRRAGISCRHGMDVQPVRQCVHRRTAPRRQQRGDRGEPAVRRTRFAAEALRG